MVYQLRVDPANDGDLVRVPVDRSEIIPRFLHFRPLPSHREKAVETVRIKRRSARPSGCIVLIVLFIRFPSGLVHDDPPRTASRETSKEAKVPKGNTDTRVVD